MTTFSAVVTTGIYCRPVAAPAGAPRTCGPGLLEIHPGGDDHLLLQAHLPYWEGLTHVVQRVSRLTGVDADVEPAVAALASAVVTGEVRLDGKLGLDDLVGALTVPGIGELAAHEIALRLGCSDAFPLPGEGSDAWRPWRALAAVHLETASVATR